MSGTGNYWEKKFWKIPELVEKLITFLDAESVSELAQAHHITVQVLQGTHSWNKLVRRTCPYHTMCIEIFLRSWTMSLTRTTYFVFGLMRGFLPRVLMSTHLLGFLG